MRQPDPDLVPRLLILRHAPLARPGLAGRRDVDADCGDRAALDWAAREYAGLPLWAGGRSAGAWVAKAEGIAQPAGDKAAFVALLQQALAVQDAAGSSHALANEVMRRRARWLLGNADDLF